MLISDWSSDVCSSDLQHQHARHAAIPFPPRPPGWTAPDRARHKTNGGKQRPRRGNGAARYACEWMTPDDLYQAGDRKPGPAAHAKPGGRPAEGRVGKGRVTTCRARWSPGT